MKSILIQTAMVAIVFFLAESLGIKHLIHSKSWHILAFFFSIYYLSDLLNSIGLKDKNKNFISFHLASVAIKLLMSMVFVAVFLFLKVDNSKIFIFNFFALYLFFTVFEIYRLSTNLRRFSEGK